MSLGSRRPPGGGVRYAVPAFIDATARRSVAYHFTIVTTMKFSFDKKLDHTVPPWVSEYAVFFITLCCAIRHRNTLAVPKIADALFNGMKVYQEQRKWWVHIALLMPDHLHMLVSFSPFVAMDKTIADWKQYQSRFLNIDWQRDFYDHRIRSDEQFMEKYEYIRMNPVRKNLAATPEDWQYVWQQK